MTTDEALRRLRKLQGFSDAEAAHAEADRILLDIISRALPRRGDEIRQAFEAVPRWYA